tara:strand:- start:4682 stop:4840 length:159 start_codon:yes stop_codon:yes gene_type:complete
MIIVEKTCKCCKNPRKFVKDSPRDTNSICGNCWDWAKNPPGPYDLCGGKPPS